MQIFTAIINPCKFLDGILTYVNLFGLKKSWCFDVHVIYAPQLKKF